MKEIKMNHKDYHDLLSYITDLRTKLRWLTDNINPHEKSSDGSLVLTRAAAEEYLDQRDAVEYTLNNIYGIVPEDE